MDTTERDGRTFAPCDDLERWDDNPRDTHEADLERLERHLEAHGQFKPLIVTTDGIVIGGNQRLRVMRRMGWEEAYVSVVEPEDEDEMMEIAMADNDRAGYYDEDRVADLMQKYDVDVSRFKVDFYAPQDLAQNLAATMDPEELLAAESDDTDAEGDPDSDGEPTTDTDTDDDSDVTERSMERLGESTSTAMVQLFMSDDEKTEFQDLVTELKRAYDLDTTSDVVVEAVRREADRARADDPDAEVNDLAAEVSD